MQPNNFVEKIVCWKRLVWTLGIFRASFLKSMLSSHPPPAIWQHHLLAENLHFQECRKGCDSVLLCCFDGAGAKVNGFLFLEFNWFFLLCLLFNATFQSISVFDNYWLRIILSFSFVFFKPFHSEVRNEVFYLGFSCRFLFCAILVSFYLLQMQLFW